MNCVPFNISNAFSITYFVKVFKRVACFIPAFGLRARSHLVTTTQTFDAVPMSSEMGCIVINIAVRT